MSASSWWRKLELGEQHAGQERAQRHRQAAHLHQQRGTQHHQQGGRRHHLARLRLGQHPEQRVQQPRPAATRQASDAAAMATLTQGCSVPVAGA